MNCPICHKELTPETDAHGVIRAVCDCAGFPRPVIEILPPAAPVKITKSPNRPMEK